MQSLLFHLSGIDEENILLTLHTRQVSKAKVITKINRINFKDVIAKLDLGSVIYPRYITSEAIIAYVRARQASLDSNIETLYHMFDHRVEAIEFRVYEESAITNIPLKDLALKKDLLFLFYQSKWCDYSSKWSGFHSGRGYGHGRNHTYRL